MSDDDRLPAGGATRVRNGTADGTPSRPWYRDPPVLVPALVTIIAAVIALVPYFFPQQQPDTSGAGKYVDPEQCLTTDWPGPGTTQPQQIRANKNVAEYAILRNKPCWRALKPQPSTAFNPAAGIPVLCWVNADDVFDTSRVRRYGWYLVADPTHPGETIGWTPQWPYRTPAHNVPVCGEHAQRPLTPLTLAAAALAGITATALIILVIRRRLRSLAPDDPESAAV
ncbi:hypothetical protein [Streptomyces sp. NPDC002078]